MIPTPFQKNLSLNIFHILFVFSFCFPQLNIILMKQKSRIVPYSGLSDGHSVISGVGLSPKIYQNEQFSQNNKYKDRNNYLKAGLLVVVTLDN
jgi:hypothetical protein